MPVSEATLPQVNQQGLDIRPTPRAEMQLYPLDTFPYEYAGREVSVKFEMPELCRYREDPKTGRCR